MINTNTCSRIGGVPVNLKQKIMDMLEDITDEKALTFIYQVVQTLFLKQK